MSIPPTQPVEGNNNPVQATETNSNPETETALHNHQNEDAIFENNLEHLNITHARFDETVNNYSDFFRFVFAPDSGQQ